MKKKKKDKVTFTRDGSIKLNGEQVGYFRSQSRSWGRGARHRSIRKYTWYAMTLSGECLVRDHQNSRECLAQMKRDVTEAVLEYAARPLKAFNVTGEITLPAMWSVQARSMKEARSKAMVLANAGESIVLHGSMPERGLCLEVVEATKPDPQDDDGVVHLKCDELTQEGKVFFTIALPASLCSEGDDD